MWCHGVVVVSLKAFRGIGIALSHQTTSGCSNSKHGPQDNQQLLECRLGQLSQPLEETFSLNSSALINDPMPIVVFQPAKLANGVGIPSGCKRRDEECTEVCIQLIWSHHNTRPGRSDFRPSCGVQRNEDKVTTKNRFICHQDHSSSSNRVELISSRRSCGSEELLLLPSLLSDEPKA